MTLREIPVDQLIPGEHNPREDFDEESMNELAETIRERGVLQPLRVRVVWPDDCSGRAECRDARWEVDAEGRIADCVEDGTCYLPDDPEDWRELKYEIICGQRRWAAAIAAGLDAVPCVIADCDDDEALIASGIENVQREDLEPIEVARWLTAIRFSSREEKLTLQEVASLVGKPTSYVERHLRLLKLPRDVQERIRGREAEEAQEGKITERHARAIHKVGDGNRQRQLAGKIEREKLTSRDADSVATAVRDNPDKADELLNTNLREEAEKSGESVDTVVRSITKPITVRKERRASVTEFGVVTDVKSAALKLKSVLERETFDDLIAAAEDDTLRMMRESLLYAQESASHALALIDERLNITTGEIRMVE